MKLSQLQLVMRVIILYIIFVFLTISCKKENEGLIEFDPTILSENVLTLTEIADDVSYIPLDNKFPLGLIYDKINFINNSIYLSAKDVGILVFNKEGKTIRKIGSIGRGPGEYVYNYSFSVDDNTETVYVWDSGNIIKVFSKTGGFLRSFSLHEYGDMINAIEAFSSKLFVSYAIQYKNTKYEWIVFDTLGNAIKMKERTVPLFTSNTGGLEGTYKFNNFLHHWNHYTDTVFSILPDLTERPSFIISPGEHRLPKARINSLEETSKYMRITQLLESIRFIVLRYYFPLKKSALVLIDKQNRKSYLHTLIPQVSGSITNYTGGIKNDLDCGISFQPQSYFEKNGFEFMIGIINPLQIKTLVKSDYFLNSVPKLTEKKNEFEQLAARLYETDNPVLMIVKLKKK